MIPYFEKTLCSIAHKMKYSGIAVGRFYIYVYSTKSDYEVLLKSSVTFFAKTF